MSASPSSETDSTSQELPRSVQNYEYRLIEYNIMAKNLRAKYWEAIEARSIARKDLDEQGSDYPLPYPFMHISTNLD